MKIKKLTLNQPVFPQTLTAIPSPPKELYVKGEPLDKLLKKPSVAIVGSRKVSPYGREVTIELAKKLSEHGITIVSGLALGVDGLTHQGALDAGGTTLAVMPCGLDRVYPSSHHQLAENILKHGGALVSEYAPSSEPFKQNFVARNRLIAGLAQAVIITEAAEKSGSLHTARFALEQGKDVLAVPGNITSPMSVGANNLIKAGATPITSYLDVLHTLGIEPSSKKPSAVKGRNESEQIIINLLFEGISDGDELLNSSGLAIQSFNQSITMLEIDGHIRPVGANHWTLS